MKEKLLKAMLDVGLVYKAGNGEIYTNYMEGTDLRPEIETVAELLEAE